MLPADGHRAPVPRWGRPLLKACLSPAVADEQPESVQVGQDSQPYGPVTSLNTAPTAHQLAMASLRQELDNTRHQVAELETLLAELPSIFERKFLNQLKPVEYQHRLLVDENLSLREQSQRYQLPAAESRFDLAPPFEPPQPVVNNPEAPAVDASFQRPNSDTSGHWIKRLSDRLDPIRQNLGLTADPSSPAKGSELVSLNEQLELATSERMNAEERLADCQQQLVSLKAVLHGLPELFEQRFQQRLHVYQAQQQLLTEENILLRRLLKDDLEAALKIIAQKISEGSIDPNQFFAKSLREQPQTFFAATE